MLECSCYSDSSSGYASTSNAFIFSLRHKEGLGPFKSMVTNPSQAINRSSIYGPTFGGGHGIFIANNANSNTNRLQTLVKPTTTLFQVEFKTRTQSWLGLATSHLMRWKCFISVDLFYHSCILVLN